MIEVKVLATGLKQAEIQIVEGGRTYMLRIRSRDGSARPGLVLSLPELSDEFIRTALDMVVIDREEDE